MTKSRFLAIIPARAGSKGIPGKNIINVAGKPLIAWTIEAALHSKFVDKTFVSSDSQEILNISSAFGAEIILRPDALATDAAPSEKVVQHAIQQRIIIEGKFDYLILLQPTSPARTASDIDKAIEVLLSEHGTSLISVYEPEHTPLKAFKLNEEGFLTGLLNDSFPFMRRQDLPKTFMPNGAIYIISKSSFESKNSFFTSKCIPFLMSIKNSIDIDEVNDIKKFERMLGEKIEEN